MAEHSRGIVQGGQGDAANGLTDKAVLVPESPWVRYITAWQLMATIAQGTNSAQHVYFDAVTMSSGEPLEDTARVVVGQHCLAPTRPVDTGNGDMQFIGGNTHQTHGVSIRIEAGERVRLRGPKNKGVCGFVCWRTEDA